MDLKEDKEVAVEPVSQDDENELLSLQEEQRIIRKLDVSHCILLDLCVAKLTDN